MYKLFGMLILSVIAFNLVAGGGTLAKSQPRGAEMLEARFDAIDTDDDGKISKSEYMAHCEKNFQLLDTNGDGVLTKREAQQNVMELMMEAKKKAIEKAEIHFNKIDINKDGRISLDEWKSALPNEPRAEEWFAAVDSNGDGFLTKEELQESVERKVRERQRKRQ